VLGGEAEKRAHLIRRAGIEYGIRGNGEIAGAQAKKHVQVQKPMATNLKTADLIITALAPRVALGDGTEEAA